MTLTLRLRLNLDQINYGSINLTLIIIDSNDLIVNRQFAIKYARPVQRKLIHGEIRENKAKKRDKDERKKKWDQITIH